MYGEAPHMTPKELYGEHNMAANALKNAGSAAGKAWAFANAAERVKQRADSGVYAGSGPQGMWSDDLALDYEIALDTLLEAQRERNAADERVRDNQEWYDDNLKRAKAAYEHDPDLAHQETIEDAWNMKRIKIDFSGATATSEQVIDRPTAH